MNLTKVTCCLFLIFNFSNLAFANEYSKIEYKITPILNSDLPTIKIENTIYGNITQKVILDLPSGWAGNNYLNQIKNIKYTKGAYIHTNKDGSKQIIIDQPENKPISISYEITQEPENSSDVHKVIIKKDLIHAVGYGLFTTPMELRDQKIKFVIKWQKLPKKWNTISSHNIERAIEFTGKVTDLLHSFYAAGMLNIKQIYNQKNSKAYISLYGNLPVKNTISAAKNIINSQQEFFNNQDTTPYYAVSLVENNNLDSYGGTALHNSFTAFLHKDSKYFITLLAHEYLHNWIGGKIKNNDQEELNYWFTEGFTDYYSRVISFRSGNISLSEFTNEVNYLLKSYYLSPVINEPNSRIKKDFWKDYDVEKLPYYRGFTFAIYLNHLIKQNSSNYSLDNIIFDLLSITKQQKSRFSTKLFKKIAKNYVGRPINKEITNFINKGKTIDLANLSDILPIKKIEIDDYDYGFNINNLTKKYIIKDLEKTSNAYQAGVRNGDKIIGYRLKTPEGYIILKTKDNTFKFKPNLKINKKEFYQIKENLSPEDELAIKKFFSNF